MLQRSNGIGAGLRAPSLRDAERFEVDSPVLAAFPEFVGQGQGDVLLTHPLGGAVVFASRLGLVLEDHMVHGDAVVEAAAAVEVDDFIDGVWRVLVLDVGERSTVAHDLQRVRGRDRGGRIVGRLRGTADGVAPRCTCRRRRRSGRRRSTSRPAARETVGSPTTSCNFAAAISKYSVFF